MSHASVAGPRDESYNSDSDSGFGRQSEPYTSLRSSVIGYRYENGRRYHRYREGQYPLPNDEKEQDRLDLLNAVYLLAGLHYEPSERPHLKPVPKMLHHAPLRQELHRVLDLGTGTGIWSIAVADAHPSAVVFGIDLSPVEADWVPPNCEFLVDDFNMSWNYGPDERFDYIHARGVSGSVPDFRQLFSEAFRCMNSNGWVEVQEDERRIYSQNNSMEDTIWINPWQQQLIKASLEFGKSLTSVLQLKQMMEDAGFVDVCEEKHAVPIGNWPKDPNLKVGHPFPADSFRTPKWTLLTRKIQTLGTFYLCALIDSVEPYTLALFTRVLGYTIERALVEIAAVKDEINRRRNKMQMYTWFYFVYGRKP